MRFISSAYRGRGWWLRTGVDSRGCGEHPGAGFSKLSGRLDSGWTKGFARKAAAVTAQEFEAVSGFDEACRGRDAA